MDHIPGSNDPNFVDMSRESDLPRAYFQPHTTTDEGGHHIVHPASNMMIGSMSDSKTGHRQPTIRIDHAFGPTSLLFVPTAAEMRVLAAALIEKADEMEAGAADLLANALKRKPGA